MEVIDNSVIQRPRAVKAALVSLVGCFYLGWMTVNGVSFGDTVKTLLILSIQVVVGLLVTENVVNFKLSAIESIAVGFATGSLVLTVLDQLSVAMNRHVNGLIPQVILLGLLAWKRRNRFRPLLPCPELLDFRLIAITPVIVMSGYGVFGPGWWLAMLIVVVATGATFLPVVTTSIRRLVAMSVLGLLACLTVLTVARPSTPPYGEWVLRPLYTGSDDLVFSESLSWSLAHFGISDYAAAVGNSVRYHWFSLAWAGLIEKLAGVGPFITTLHVVPTTTFAVLAWLIFAVIRVANQRESAATVAVFTLFATAVAIEPHRFFDVLNTSNIVPFLWFLLIPCALIGSAKDTLRGAPVVIALLVGVAFLAKAPFGAAALVGAETALLVMWLRDRRRSHVLTGFLTGLTSIASYLLFLSPHQWEQRRFRISWTFANLAPDSSLYPLVPIVLIAAILFILFIGLLGRPCKFAERSTTVLTAFLCGASLIGLLRFVISGGSAEMYFFNVTILCASIVTGVGVVTRADSRNHLTPNILIAAAIISFALMTIDLQYGILSRVTSEQVALIVGPLIYPVAIVTLFWIACTTLRSSIHLDKVLLIMVASLAASSAQLVEILRQPEQYVMTTQVASVEDVSALTWLRNSTPKDAIVATNRFLCPINESCDFDDSSFLVSAVGHRRVLVEGPRFVIGGRPYPDWMNARILLSTRFAESPTKTDLRTLQGLGVDWFILDERFLRNSTFAESDWDGIGSIRHHEHGVAIIELASR